MFQALPVTHLFLMSTDLPYLRSYPASLQDQARDLLQQGKLAAVLLRKYP